MLTFDLSLNIGSAAGQSEVTGWTTLLMKRGEPMSYLDTIETLAGQTIAEGAHEVDQSGAFPQATVDAFRNAGLLGLISSKDVGGMGEGPRAAALAIERVARECGSSAMVLCMHYAGTMALERFGSDELRRQNAAGEHLLTLAFSEAGSRSHFWAPVGTAQKNSGGVELNAEKSWVTSANHATAYIWSSQPLSAEGASSLWWVPRNTEGVSSPARFNGLGLRGNDSTPVSAKGAIVPESSLLGEDGGGLGAMLQTVMPLFNVMAAACAIGLMEGATRSACEHASATRYEYTDESLSDFPTIRAYLARMRIGTDQARCLLLDTIDAMESGREDMLLRVLECKAAAGEAATHVLDMAMRVCGGAAFRREVGVERRFRDARAGTVMSPTTDQLYDFIGRAICGMEVF
jgi:alkylation response protein AidB-like acyl-CoA dehydrogenase